MRNILLTIMYDGTEYFGWQLQPDHPTIAREIMKALERIIGKAPTLYVSGRTDAGVHALGQRANFYTDSSIDIFKLKEALNAMLPSDIAITQAEEVDIDFNARSSAVNKTYMYLIYNMRYLSPFFVNRAWHIKHNLDMERMRDCAEAIKGEHDFKAFMASGSIVQNTVRTVYSLDIEKQENLIRITVTGNGFLYNMVRIIAGTLVYAGSGKLNRSDVEQIILSKDRTKGAKTAPACGLYLKGVNYK